MRSTSATRSTSTSCCARSTKPCRPWITLSRGDATRHPSSKSSSAHTRRPTRARSARPVACARRSIRFPPAARERQSRPTANPGRPRRLAGSRSTSPSTAATRSCCGRTTRATAPCCSRASPPDGARRGAAVGALATRSKSTSAPNRWFGLGRARAAQWLPAQHRRERRLGGRGSRSSRSAAAATCSGGSRWMVEKMPVAELQRGALARHGAALLEPAQAHLAEAGIGQLARRTSGGRESWQRDIRPP